MDNTNWLGASSQRAGEPPAPNTANKKSQWKNVKESTLISPAAVVEAFEAEYNPNSHFPHHLLSKLIVNYGKMQLGHRILDIVSIEIEKGSLRPNRVLVTALLSALSRSGDLDSVLVLYHLMLPRGINSVVLIAIIDALSRSGHFELIPVLWKDWRETKEYLPTLNLYTTIAEAAIKAMRFDVWIEAELASRKDYDDAIASRKLSQIASSQLTAKHCIHVSQLLILRWIPNLRLIPDSTREALSERLQRWQDIRPALPGLPLTKAEIEEWRADMDLVFLTHENHGPLELAAATSSDTKWNDFYDELTDDVGDEAHEANILEALDKIKRNSESSSL